MAISDIFEKLDDIIYEPIHVLVSYVGEPLKWLENQRKVIEETAVIKKETDLRIKEKKIEQLIEQKKLEAELNARRESAKLENDIRKWDEEVNNLIADSEMERRDKLVESIKRYQLDLATASKDIVESIGKMSLELREKANNMVSEKTKEYIETQKDVKKQSWEEMREAKEMFADDAEMLKMVESQILNERASMIELTNDFIKELADDMKRLNENADKILAMSMETTKKYLDPIAKNLQIDTSVNSNINTKQLEDDSTIEVPFKEK